jgi:sporulation protein YabP
MEKDSKLILVNRKSLTITGIKKVLAVSDSALSLLVDSSNLTVLGEGMEVKKLDVDSGIIEVEGKINNIKYLTPREKLNLFKRIFK